MTRTYNFGTVLQLTGEFWKIVLKHMVANKRTKIVGPIWIVPILYLQSELRYRGQGGNPLFYLENPLKYSYLTLGSKWKEIWPLRAYFEWFKREIRGKGGLGILFCGARNR